MIEFKFFYQSVLYKFSMLKNILVLLLSYLTTVLTLRDVIKYGDLSPLFGLCTNCNRHCFYDWSLINYTKQFIYSIEVRMVAALGNSLQMTPMAGILRMMLGYN